MSVENEILSEEQQKIAAEAVKSLCTPGGCRVASRFDCSFGELIDNRLPFCYANKSKRALLEEAVENIASTEGIGAEIITPILKFLAEAKIVTKDELKDWRSRQPKLTLRQIVEGKAQKTAK